MFEEVPRERRGVARLLPVQRVVLGPFVLGGGMLVAALGGSVAVAAAATMITASAIGSSDNDLPARPGQVVAPSTSPDESVSARRTPARQLPARPGRAGTASSPPAAGLATSQGAAGLGAAGGSAGGGGAGGGGAGGGSGSAGEPRLSSVAPPASTTAARPGAGERTTAPSTPPGSPTPTPSVSSPLGNAVIHVNGYDQASGRLVYQFATIRPHAGIGGGDLYLISGRQSYSAALAPSITITSGGGICLPAGSACTPDQVIRAADSGFFARVAIASGVLRSIIEVGYEPAAAKLSPAPSASVQPDSSRRGRPSSSPPAPSPTVAS